MLARLSRTERLFTQAQKLFVNGEIERAIHTFQAAHTLSPDHYGVCLHLALALSEAGCRNEACEVMQQAITLRPCSSVLYLFLGQIYFDHEDFTEAKKQFLTAHAIDPFNVNTQTYLGLIALIEGDIQQSYDALTRPISIPAGTTEQTVHRLGISSPPSTLQLANVALQSRLLVAIESYFLKHELSPRSLSRQLADLPQSLPPNIPSRCLSTIDSLLTHIVLGTKRFFVLLRFFYNRNLRRDAIRHIRADESYYLCQTSQAIVSYQQILTQRPDSSIVKQRLFELQYESGDFDKALTYLLELTCYGTPQHKPTPSDCLYLGELFYLGGKAQEGRRYLDQAVTSQMNEFKLYYFIGLDELRAGRKKNARQRFAQSLRLLNPDICLLRLNELNRIHPQVKHGHSIHKTVPIALEQK